MNRYRKAGLRRKRTVHSRFRTSRIASARFETSEAKRMLEHRTGSYGQAIARW